MKKEKINSKILILHNIRSSHNIGSIFRTADAIGIKKIFITGYTPKPINHFGVAQKEIAKTALGAEKIILWEYFKNISYLLKKIKKEGYKIIAIEQDKKSIDYKKISIKKEDKISFILGNEVRGLSSNILKQCDLITEIPMKGKKESLNVSVAFGVLIFRILDK